MRVFLVDDHEVVRRGVAELIQDEAADLTVVGQAGSVTQALALIPLANPNVAVLDVRLPDGNGIELCRELRSSIPTLRCLMLTSFPDQQAIADAVMAGAAGYVLKDINGMTLIKAIRQVGAGTSLIAPRDAARTVQQLQFPEQQTDPTFTLSRQERTVLALIGDGLSNREIADRMFLAEKTVKNYVSNLLMKLGMQRRTQAAVLSTRLRLHSKP